MDFIKRLKKAKPWEELEKNFKLSIKCECCDFEFSELYQSNIGELLCNGCAEAHDNRTRLLNSEKEFGF